MTPPTCCGTNDTCTRPPIQALRVQPRRTETPLCNCVRRATAWPRAADPVTLRACATHLKEIRDAASCVLSSQTLGDGVRTVAYTDDEHVNATVTEAAS